LAFKGKLAFRGKLAFKKNLAFFIPFLVISRQNPIFAALFEQLDS
jgi:hypothetical protein